MGWSSGWLVAATLLLAGCDATGSATTRIDQAEQEIESLAASIVDAVELEVTSERPLGARTRCELPGGRIGAANTLSLRGPLPELDDPVGRGAALLVDAGYTLVDSDVDGIFGRRDGIRVTIVVDAPTEQLAIDAHTSCRALPDS